MSEEVSEGAEGDSKNKNPTVMWGIKSAQTEPKIFARNKLQESASRRCRFQVEVGFGTSATVPMFNMESCDYA